VGAALFEASGDAGMSDLENPLVYQGIREGSNVQPARELVDLLTAMRLYEANMRMVRRVDQRAAQLIEMANG